MTYDQTSTKLWYHGEYEPLDRSTLREKLTNHETHCQYSRGTEVGVLLNEA